MCSTRQHEIEGKNAVVIQLFIAAGLMIGKEMSFQDENCDDIHTAACLCAYLVYLHVGSGDGSSTSLDSLSFCDAAEDEFSRKIIAKSNGERL